MCVAHRVGERAALVDLLADLGEHRLELLVVGLLGQRAQRLGQRDAGLEQRRQLAREDRDLLRAHALEETTEIDLAPEPRDRRAARAVTRARRRLRGAARQHLAVLGDEHAVLAQHLAQHLGAVGVLGAGDVLAGGVQPFPGVDRHQLASCVVIIRTSAVVVRPASTFCAPSSRSVRMPDETAVTFSVCASTFLIASWRIFSSMIRSS